MLGKCMTQFEWPWTQFENYQVGVDPEVVDAEVARAGAAGEYDSDEALTEWRAWLESDRKHFERNLRIMIDIFIPDRKTL